MFLKEFHQIKKEKKSRQKKQNLEIKMNLLRSIDKQRRKLQI
jgi:hypothetical protein